MIKLKFLVFSPFLVVALIVNAQSVGSGASGSGYITPTTTVYPAPVPVPPPVDYGFIQFNNLTVESVSATNLPAEILASNPSIYPLMGMEGDKSSSGVLNTTCYEFGSRDASKGTSVACPTPKINNQPYRIEVDVSTKLYLRDRTLAVLSDFTAGDQINVFGYYNTDGSIQAYLVRDLSKPVQSEFIQLNNVNLISISALTTPATLIVAQSQGYPCYGFGASGSIKQSIICPMGVESASSNATLKNLAVPQAFAPTWERMRKYVINIDAQTIILDSNRTRIQLSDLRVGDQLNIYGETKDNGQTLNADIVRDLSIPAFPSTYSGKVITVNADGSFVIQTSDGRTITVKNPIQVGAAVQITGLLDRLTSILSQVTSIIIGGGFIPMPLPATVPGAQR